MKPSDQLRIASWGAPADPAPDPLEYVLGVEVINEGESIEYVAAVYVIGPAGEHNLSRHFRRDREGDHELKPRARLRIEHRVNPLTFEMGAMFTAEAVLAGGLVVSSDPGSSHSSERKKPPTAAAVQGVELAGLEPATSWVRSRRSPN